MREPPRRAQFQRKIFLGAQAGIDRHHDRQRDGRLFIEDGDLLLAAVFEDVEIVFLQVGDGSAAPVGDRRENTDQFDVNLDCAVWPSSAEARDGGFGTGLGDCARHRTVPVIIEKENQGFHRETNHLDADFSVEMPSARGISAGNGSPSAQTAPSSKYSFFQMGTVLFSVSITQRQASKAAARCAEATTINTLVSPISSRPSRWTSAHLADPKLLNGLLRQRFHLLQSHLFIGFVVEIKRAPAAGIVPHHAVKQDRRAIFRDASRSARSRRYRSLSRMMLARPLPPLTGGSKPTSSPAFSLDSGPAYS